MHSEDMLIVRACKTKDPMKRLNMIFRRLYPNAKSLSQNEINGILIYYVSDVYERTMRFRHIQLSVDQIFTRILKAMQFDMDNTKKHRGDTAFYMIDFLIKEIGKTSQADWPDDMIWPKYDYNKQ